MRTKTLLIAAAALAVGIISSEAQVYSQNVVGYVNVTVPSHGYTFVGNQLQNGTDANQSNNNVQGVLKTGFVSDPDFNNNTVLYWWNGGGYNIFYYFTDADAGNQFDPTFGDGWYSGSGSFANVSLVQGAGGGHYLYNPTGTPLTNTLTGTVVQGTNIYTINQGYNTYTLPEPVSTNLNSALVGFPGTSDPDFNNNDIYYHFNGVGYDILYYFTDADAGNQFDPTFGDGWYTGSGSFGSSNPALWPKVGEGFLINHVAATTVMWTNVFKVQ